MAERPIPSYKKPPVVEVVWSVQFAELPWLTAAHTGLFWQQILEQYPRCEEHPPIEKKDEPERLLQPRRITAELRIKPPLCRQWFVSESGNEIVQLQSDRFCFNWRRVRPADMYPRYAHIREQFFTRWRGFCDFAQKTSGEAPRVDLLEMTYVNHIPREEGWSEASEIGKVFPSVSFRRDSEFLPAPATLGCSIVFDLQGEKGRLYVVCHHAKQMEPEERDVFRLEFTARGKPEQTDHEGMLAWFADAREWIVRGFADLTDRQMQADQWERER